MIKIYRLKQDTKLKSHTDYGTDIKGIPVHLTFSKGFEVRQNSEYSMNYYGKNISFKRTEIENNPLWELINSDENIEYFKCNSKMSIKNSISIYGSYTIGKIYKGKSSIINNVPILELKDDFNIETFRITHYKPFDTVGDNHRFTFIPSTKEEYDAQNIESLIKETTMKEEIKKDTFVLPKKWFIKRNKTNASVLNDWENKTYNNGSTYAFLDSRAYMFSDCAYQNYQIDGYTEITFKQFEKYVIGKQPNSINNIPKMYSLDTIKSKLSEYYDKEDVKDILETITK